MKRLTVGIVLGVMLLAGPPLGTVWGADLQVIQTHKSKDMAVTLLNESGQWTQGKNTFVLEFTAAATRPARGRGERHPEHQHGDARHGSDARGRHAVP